MIVYDLRCSHGHAFEGWFASGEEFARQVDARLVHCPLCDDAQVERVPSAKFKVSRKQQAAVRSSDKPSGRASEPASAAAPASSPAAESQEAVSGVPAELIAKLREIVRSTEDVGERFPEEARKIHYDEVPARSIRGRASREEAQALTDEGIEFSPLPSILTRESH